MMKSSPWKVNNTEFQSPDGNLVLKPLINALMSSKIPIMVKKVPKTTKNFDKKVEILKTFIRVMAESFLIKEFAQLFVFFPPRRKFRHTTVMSEAWHVFLLSRYKLILCQETVIIYYLITIFVLVIKSPNQILPSAWINSSLLTWNNNPGYSKVTSYSPGLNGELIG